MLFLKVLVNCMHTKNQLPPNNKAEFYGALCNSNNLRLLLADPSIRITILVQIIFSRENSHK